MLVKLIELLITMILLLRLKPLQKLILVSQTLLSAMLQVQRKLQRYKLLSLSS